MIFKYRWARMVAPEGFGVIPAGLMAQKAQGVNHR